jgi:hypothetical protein
MQTLCFDWTFYGVTASVVDSFLRKYERQKDMEIVKTTPGETLWSKSQRE